MSVNKLNLFDVGLPFEILNQKCCWLLKGISWISHMRIFTASPHIYKLGK